MFGLRVLHARSRGALQNGDFAASLGPSSPPFWSLAGSCSPLTTLPRPAAIGPRDAPLHCLYCCSTPRTDHLAPSACSRAGTKDGRTGHPWGTQKRSRYLVATMDHGGGGGSGIWIRAAVAVAAGAAIAARAVRRKSVDSSAVFVGVPAMVAHTVAGYRLESRLFSVLPFRWKGSPMKS